MGTDQATNGTGDNSLAATNAAIVSAFETMDDLEKKRALINDKINAERKNLYANYGVTPSALSRGRSLWKLDEGKRATEQLAQAVVESAIGIAQTDLFEKLSPLEKPEKKKPGRPPKAAADASAAPA